MAPAARDTPFRSADMSMVQLYISNEIGREVVNALGEIGLVQFRDLNGDVNAFQRAFTQEIRRLDNVERQLRYFATQMEKAGVPLRKLDLDTDSLAAPSTAEIDGLAERCQSLEHRVFQLNDSYETLKKREVELTEWRWVLREAGGFFDRAHGNVDEIRASTDGGGGIDSIDDDAPLLNDVEQSGGQSASDRQQQASFGGMNIGFVAGVIARDRVGAFERILWRTLRGNLYMNQSEIPEPLVDPSTNESVHKNVFVIFAHGSEILAKIRKISESMSAEVYSVDENSDLRRDQIHEVNARLSDVQNVLRNTQTTLDAELEQIARSLSAWMVLISKEKAVYDTLNLFSYDRARRTLIAEGWCPTNDLPLIRTTLQDVTNRAGLAVPSIINEIRTNKKPPTYLKTNKFTEGFQTIVNAYGTATYQEVNPALPVIVTFPFLFAVMFGDFGHAVIMLSAALAMIYWEKPLKKVTFELFAMVYYGRYIALVMAVFSVFTGLVYNDVFSKSMTLFPSAWEWDVPPNFRDGMTVSAKLKGGYRYPFGLDWMWHGTENDLLFSNSYKMKMSIILGWAHMTYSLCFSYINARHFKKTIDIWGNFVPGMIFFQAIFGYLVMCILYKWSVDWLAIGQSPPGLLNMLIYMFLQPGSLDMRLYKGQEYVQVILLLLAFAQVPILLFLKPLYLRWEHNKARGHGYRGIGERSHVSALDGDDDDDDNNNNNNAALGNGNGNSSNIGHARRASHLSLDSDGGEGVGMLSQDIGGGGGDDDEHEEFEFSEVMIHQVIHTIEFCLNCVSHTASYLRLWALSLAHQQLSAVLWSMTLAPALNMRGITGVIAIVITFTMFFSLSVIILIVMEGVSAMLHSLRLAWVESFSKFAEFGGWPFAPFSFKQQLEESEELKEYLG
ncbi:V-type H+-transporting ATPase subunit I [Sporothrix brasiliensis 5110]|uniref:V-type proton ATPase subunit a n=1 Tax=Sporothrix brasiliensis 5110 TaxID=1398154 RepID=A0A0C2IQX6_9PEZI|nr:V-type H+-transporting ATPase subunit I [Sporothrix brasiliensis 5110]KIH91426.1 V-type H+-transporting ATPase subunit I [Sporothrix brasiliensis 5110]